MNDRTGNRIHLVTKRWVLESITSRECLDEREFRPILGDEVNQTFL